MKWRQELAELCLGTQQEMGSQDKPAPLLCIVSLHWAFFKWFLLSGRDGQKEHVRKSAKAKTLHETKKVENVRCVRREKWKDYSESSAIPAMAVLSLVLQRLTLNILTVSQSQLLSHCSPPSSAAIKPSKSLCYFIQVVVDLRRCPVYISRSTLSSMLTELFLIICLFKIAQCDLFL